MTTPNIFDSVLNMKTGIDSDIDDATQIAISAQRALQQIQNNEASGNTSVFSWSTVFSGSDGSSLNGTDFSASTGIKIRGSNGFVGIDETVGNGLYRADIAYPFLTSNQSASVVVGSIDDGSTAVSYLLFQCNSTRTEGAYVYIYKDTLKLGKWTRSGSTYTFNTPLASISTTIKPGNIIRAYNTGNTFYVKVNNVQRLAITDSGNTITRDASHVYTSFLMERNSFLYVGDGPRFSSFAMSDDTAGGVPVSDSWLFTRSSQTTSALSVSNGNSALLPASFFSTQNYLVGAVLNDLGLGKVKINVSDWYELTASIMAVTGGGGSTVTVGADWAVYVDGAQITGSAPCGVPIKVFLNKDAIVQPMVVASSSSNPYGYDLGLAKTMEPFANYSSVRGFASWAGKKAA